MQQKNGLSSLEHTKASDPLIRVEQLTKIITTHTQKTTLLSDINFSVPDGSLFAVNGPSGSGKSTILNMLTGIDRPTSGHVYFNDKELRGRSENELARWRGQHVGIIFQFFQLIPTLTALENILLAIELGGGRELPRRTWKTQALACLEKVGLEDYAKRLPSELSGGQQQRVAIARALANNPPVLIADEPTGNLDSKTAQQIFDLLESLIQYGKTIIYVTHDPSLARRATAQIDLLDGRIVGERNTNIILAFKERERL